MKRRTSIAFFGFWLSAAAGLHAQTRGAELTREQKPVYPESLSKAIAQGNVILIGLIDKNGTVQDAKAVFTTHEQFVEPSRVHADIVVSGQADCRSEAARVVARLGALVAR